MAPFYYHSVPSEDGKRTSGPYLRVAVLLITLALLLLCGIAGQRRPEAADLRGVTKDFSIFQLSMSTYVPRPFYVYIYIIYMNIQTYMITELIT